MKQFKRDFLDLCVSRNILRFGQFELKSGRVSPYFFNAGLFDTGQALAQLCRHYVAALQERDMTCDCLFGPAYKGIPLAAGIAWAFGESGLDMPFAYNRKEEKDHGEGGNVVGGGLRGRVVIVDDVISAGTSVRESFQLIEAAGAQVSGVAIALDRQERGTGDMSAVQEVESQLKIPVASIATLADLLDYLRETPQLHDVISSVEAYRERYGVQ